LATQVALVLGEYVKTAATRLRGATAVLNSFVAFIH
jgi:hypothetical protein